ncbi:MAG: hypothetical protein AABW87_03315, partial [Nanoarchaeota archaeon]
KGPRPAREYGATFYWSTRIMPKNPFQNAIPRVGHTKREESTDGLARRLINVAESTKALAGISKEKLRVRIVENCPNFRRLSTIPDINSGNHHDALTEGEYKSLMDILREHI